MNSGPDLPIAPGHVFAGKYRVERVIGAGGMGMVVAATHLDLGELRAVKFMLPSSVGDTVALERFFREGRAAGKLKSDHVARVYDVGRTEHGAPYIVMEYLEGRDLANLLKSGPIPIARAVDFVVQACDALAEAHAAGIVHRDLKPANLFLTTGADGSAHVKVLDFGISKVGEAGAPSQLTQTDASIGSPFHMSPEQMRASRKVDHRTDIWSLGVVLYQLVTGVLPFQGEGRYAVCFAIAEDAPVPPRTRRPEIPTSLDAAILRCLEKNPEARFPSIAALCEAIAPLSPFPETATVLRRIRRLGGYKFDESTTDGGSFVRAQTVEPEASLGKSENATESSWGQGKPSARRSGRAVPVVIGASLATLAALAAGGRFYMMRTAEPPALATRSSDAPTPAPSIVVSVSASAPSVASAAPSDEASDGAASASASATAAPGASSSASANALEKHAPARPWVAPRQVAPPATPPQPQPASDPWGHSRKL